jgi:hypothetical protein
MVEHEEDRSLKDKLEEEAPHPPERRTCED